MLIPATIVCLTVITIYAKFTDLLTVTTQNILVLAILSGRHCNTLVDLAIVLFYQGQCYKNPRLD